MRPLLLLAVLLVLVAACDQQTTAVAVVSEIRAASGDGQVGTVGEELAAPLVVRVLTDAGGPAAGVPVIWTVAEGDGSLIDMATSTNGSGRSSADWVLGGVAGQQSVRAEVEGVATGVVFSAVAEPGEAASITVGRDTISFTSIADSVVVTARALDAYGNEIPAPHRWTTSDPAVATVVNGSIAAAGAGTAVVTATRDEQSDTIEVVVDPVPVTFDVAPDSVRFTALGDTVALSASILDANGYDVAAAAATYVVEDSAIVACSNGVLVSTANGVTWVKAAVGELTDSVYVVMEQATTRLDLAPDSVRFTALGDTLPVSAAVLDANGHAVEGIPTSFSVVDSMVVTYSDGALIARANGTTWVRVTGGMLRDSIHAAVEQVALLTIDPTVRTLEALEDTVRFRARLEDANGNGMAAPPIQWESGDSSVATISSDGLATARSNGTVAIVASTDGHRDSVRLVIDQVATSLTVDVTDMTLAWSAEEPVVIQATDRNGFLLPPDQLSITSTGSGIAALEPEDASAGLWRVMGKGLGYASMVASADGIEARVAVRVEPSAHTAIGGQGLWGHICALHTEGDVSCWGPNQAGQLGNGTTDYSATPVRVATSVPFTVISLGSYHTCALDEEGAAHCWGGGGRGQLGDGRRGVATLPTPVHTDLRFVTLESGYDYTCGIDADRRLHCWGSNSYGQFGDGLPGEMALTPIPAGDGKQWSQVSASLFHMCGIDIEGDAYCWGSNSLGALGTGDTEWHTTPVRVASTARYVSIHTGSGRTCAVRDTGEADCWGRNPVGELGIGYGAGDQLTPARVEGGPFRRIFMGEFHACGEGADDVTYCWGAGANGQLGNDEFWNYPIPVPVSGSHRFVAMALLNWTTCGIATSGSVYCWGHHRQIGTGLGYESAAPAAVTGSAGPFLDIDGGRSHSCALDTNGEAWCWGTNEVYNALGEVAGGVLGIGSAGGAYAEPQKVLPSNGGTATYTQLATGSSISCGLGTDQRIHCWGFHADYVGEQPVPLDPSLTFSQVATGQRSVCGLGTDERMYCRGVGSTSLQLMSDTLAFRTLAAGTNYACGIATDGRALCTGTNGSGQLGSGTDTAAWNGFVEVVGGRRYTSISTAGDSHLGHSVCAVAEDGTGWCWGTIRSHESGAREDTNVPVQVPGWHDWTEIQAGSYGFCGVATDGRAMCWGNHPLNAQPSDSPFTPKPTTEPAPVHSDPGLVSVSAGHSHACGLTDAGAAYCWGGFDKGKLGNGEFAQTPHPIPVPTGGPHPTLRGAP